MVRFPLVAASRRLDSGDAGPDGEVNNPGRYEPEQESVLIMRSGARVLE